MSDSFEPFEPFADEFLTRTAEIIWCTATTVDARGRPRSRILHPIWEVRDGAPVGWVVTGRTPVKTRHLAANPHMACMYWSPAQNTISIVAASPEALRATGLSRTKAAALQALARLSVDGTLAATRLETRSTDDALAALRGLPGIGPWSAGLVLLRGLRRMDVFPASDVGAARSLTALLGLPTLLTPAQASGIAERFGNRRGYLYFLCLGSQLLAREEIAPPRSAGPC